MNESRVPNSESQLSWYVIQTKPTAEEIVRQHLANARLVTFLPKIRQMVRGQRRSSSRIKPLFPSYLFVQLDLADPSRYRMVRYTRGVRKILGDGALPTAVPNEMIDIIRERVDGSGVIEQSITMKKGDEVKIRSGVFRDLVGILERPVSSAGRVRVLLQIMKHQVKCEMSAAEIEKV